MILKSGCVMRCKLGRGDGHKKASTLRSNLTAEDGQKSAKMGDRNRVRRSVTLSGPAPARREGATLIFVGLILLFSLAGCRTAPAPLPAINLSEAGWKLRDGQALWRSAKDAPEIAGEVTLALHPDGRSWVQFTKTPLPFLSAEITKEGWRIEFIPERRVFFGRGVPPARLLWLHLARALNGLAPPAPLRFEKSADGGGRLENRSTGETLTLYL